MITRDDIRELAAFQASRPEDCAISFYFEPRVPQNKSHREEAILAKDLVKNAMREAEKNGKNGCARGDLHRILDIAENLHGNQARAKAIFACGGQNFWREFDLPPQPFQTQLFVNQQFHLKPLAQLLGAHPRVWLAVVDRQKARIFDQRLDDLVERICLFRKPAVRQGRGDGYSGYDGGRAQRRVSDEALHHFKGVAEYLQSFLEKGLYEKLIIGCPDTTWRELESQLHPYVKNVLLGRVSAEVASMNQTQIHEKASEVLDQSQDSRLRDLVTEVLDQAKSNHRGVTGLRRVLRSLELGEVQTLLLGENFSHAAALCNSCGHIDAHLVRYCPACGRETREIEDVCDTMIPMAIRRDIELFYVKDDAAFDSAGNIAALLRFRADQNKNTGMPAAS